MKYQQFQTKIEYFFDNNKTKVKFAAIIIDTKNNKNILRGGAVGSSLGS